MKTVTLDLYEYQQMEKEIERLKEQLEKSKEAYKKKHVLEVVDTKGMKDAVSRKDIVMLKITQESARRYFDVRDNNILVDICVER